MKTTPYVEMRSLDMKMYINKKGRRADILVCARPPHGKHPTLTRHVFHARVRHLQYVVVGAFIHSFAAKIFPIRTMTF